MGDILHALPAVTALRAMLPGCTLGWAVEPQWRSLLCADSQEDDPQRGPAMPLVDRLHVVPAKHWGREPLAPTTLRSILAVRRELRAGRYDVALDLQGALRSAVIARWAGPKRLLGEDEPRERAARWLFTERVPSAGVHVIEQLADVVRAFVGERFPLGLPALPHDREAQHWCEEAGVGRHLGLSVMLHPGAGWGAKRWPPERYARVGVMLAQRTGCRVVVHAGPGELELGNIMVAYMRAVGLEPLLVSPTVSELIELTRNVTLVVGGDSGPLHLAAALDKPTVGIFGPTDPARNGPFHGAFRILRDPGSRRDHTRHTEPEAGLLKIMPEEVVDAALELLAPYPPARKDVR